MINLNKTIVHFEIPANDVEKLKSFYEELLGWKFINTSMPGMEYWMIHTVPTDENGMIQKPGINGGARFCMHVTCLIFKSESDLIGFSYRFNAARARVGYPFEVGFNSLGISDSHGIDVWQNPQP